MSGNVFWTIAKAVAHDRAGHDESSVVTFASRSLRVIATVAILCVVSVSPVLAENVFYTTSGFGAKLFAIDVSDSKITTKGSGLPTGGGNCVSLALSPSGTLYSMCGTLFGTQYLATIDPKTGAATLFGGAVSGLAVMAMAFAPNGILYAIGDPTADLNYNSLYTVDKDTGVFTRVGSTGAPEFFMDLAFDRHGKLFGVTTTLSPSYVPAILYGINTSTGKATKIVNLVGNTQIMGLAFGRDGELYATDFGMNPGLYEIDVKTGFETAIAALPFGFSSGLELANPHEHETD